jgi:hypothetical protein
MVFQFNPIGLMESVESGFIWIWHGSVASIPRGWHLCDGSDGTPDLRSKFVLCTDNSSYPVGSTGGSLSHSHGVTTTLDPVGSANPTTLLKVNDQDFLITATGTTDVQLNTPPYYALAYVMKV